MRLAYFIAFIFCTIFFVDVKAQTPVKWSASYNSIDENTGEVLITASIGIDWHIYSQMQSGDGPLPTVFKFERTPDFDLVDGVEEPSPQTAYSDVFSAEVMMFSNEVVFTQKIKRNNKKAFTILGNVECMACNNTSCLPPKMYKLSIQVPSLD